MGGESPDQFSPSELARIHAYPGKMLPHVTKECPFHPTEPKSPMVSVGERIHREPSALESSVAAVPTATNRPPPKDTSRRSASVPDAAADQLRASREVRIAPPSPTATSRPSPEITRRKFARLPVACGAQAAPSSLVHAAPESPTATNCDPVHTTSRRFNRGAMRPAVHSLPSVLLRSVPAVPTATNTPLPKATPPSRLPPGRGLDHCHSSHVCPIRGRAARQTAPASQRFVATLDMKPPGKASAIIRPRRAPSGSPELLQDRLKLRRARSSKMPATYPRPFWTHARDIPPDPRRRTRVPRRAGPRG